jgi:hypothetical protein
MNDAVVTTPTAATDHLGFAGVTARDTQTSATDNTQPRGEEADPGAEDQIAYAACATALGREGGEPIAPMSGGMGTRHVSLTTVHVRPFRPSRTVRPWAGGGRLKARWTMGS